MRRWPKPDAWADGGRTWGPAEPTALPSPESMVRMLRLRSGNLLVVWNNVSSTTQQPRHPLAAALSKHGGRTWGAPKVIADEVGSNQLSNHGLIQLDDGRILLGISHYRDVRPMLSTQCQCVRIGSVATTWSTTNTTCGPARIQNRAKRVSGSP